MKKFIIQGIKFYQRAISPYLGKNCIYIPTCSQYMIDAINRYGVCKGGSMGVKRILRCHPFAKGGFDPIPNKLDKKK